MSHFLTDRKTVTFWDTRPFLSVVGFPVSFYTETKCLYLEEITMENYSMMLPHYSIGADIYNKIPEFCKPYGKKIIAIGGHTAMSVARPLIE